MLLVFAGSISAAVKDTPYLQESSVKFQNSAELAGAKFRKLEIDRDGVVYVLTDKGVARLFESTLALDRSFRPLAGKVAADIQIHEGNLWYLFEDSLLSNGAAGTPLIPLPKGPHDGFAIADASTALVSSGGSILRVFQKKLTPIQGIPADFLHEFVPIRNEFFVASGKGVYRVFGTQAKLFYQSPAPVTCMVVRGTELIVGTTQGYIGVNANDAKVITPMQDRLPSVELTSLTVEPTGELWVGSKHGAFRISKSGQISYYASKRWLEDDDVVDARRSPDGHGYVLTRSGLARIRFEPMTLEQKAAYFDRKVRQRHNRYGFAAELRLARPGDISSAEMIDTDNDGTWSNYYMASQAFRYAVTGDAEARTNAWRTFEAMERLEKLPELKGFPARTFERTGFKVSDPDRWRPSSDTGWEWKGHTSSDEIAAHTFGCATMFELVARSPGERDRVSRFYEKIVKHILDHNLQLVDVDGKPTLWGRWNPEYVNHYPASIIDRRLNSAELISSLQLAYKMTTKELYKRKAYELMDKHGYLTNILNSVTNIALTPGFIHEGNDMGNEWNHSDDLLSFVTYWVLHRFAFTEDLRLHYVRAIEDHWEMEKLERNPLWNFVYASTGARDYDPDGAVWTLRKFPLDLITWSVSNSHRLDITKLPPNFRKQELKELLSPAERQITRWNTQPFILDGGDGGRTEFAGDEYLLPYWMGRYLKIIR